MKNESSDDVFITGLSAINAPLTHRNDYQSGKSLSSKKLVRNQSFKTKKLMHIQKQREVMKKRILRMEAYKTQIQNLYTARKIFPDAKIKNEKQKEAKQKNKRSRRSLSTFAISNSKADQVQLISTKTKMISLVPDEFKCSTIEAEIKQRVKDNHKLEKYLDNPAIKHLFKMKLNKWKNYQLHILHSKQDKYNKLRDFLKELEIHQKEDAKLNYI